MFFEWCETCLLGMFHVGAAYAVAVLCHESGHAIFGMLFGAKCLWIRVGSVLWVPGGGVFVKAGRGGRTPGECVLSCPDKKSCVWAAVGGPAVNLLTGAAGAWGWHLQELLEGGAFSIFSVFKIIFPGVSCFMALLNLFPCKAGGKNDGKMAGELCKDKEFYKKMRKNQQRDLLRLEFGILEEMF